LLIIDNAVVVVLVAINRETQGTGTYVKLCNHLT
jgi:hypothetical protein